MNWRYTYVRHLVHVLRRILIIWVHAWRSPPVDLSLVSRRRSSLRSFSRALLHTGPCLHIAGINTQASTLFSCLGRAGSHWPSGDCAARRVITVDRLRILNNRCARGIENLVGDVFEGSVHRETSCWKIRLSLLLVYYLRLLDHGLACRHISCFVSWLLRLVCFARWLLVFELHHVHGCIRHAQVVGAHPDFWAAHITHVGGANWLWASPAGPSIFVGDIGRVHIFILVRRSSARAASGDSPSPDSLKLFFLLCKAIAYVAYHRSDLSLDAAWACSGSSLAVAGRTRNASARPACPLLGRLGTCELVLWYQRLLNAIFVLTSSVEHLRLTI